MFRLTPCRARSLCRTALEKAAMGGGHYRLIGESDQTFDATYAPKTRQGAPKLDSSPPREYTPRSFHSFL